jgi:outer membrane protease
MKRSLAAAAMIVMVCAFPLAVQAAGVDIWAGVGKLSGDTTYAIGGEEYWTDPISELVWPLDVWMGSLGVSAEFGSLFVSGEGFINLTSDSGQMEDSDWGILFVETGGNPRFSPDSLDIFSTSDATLDATILDLKARYRLIDLAGVSLAAGAGWLYQNFTSEASNLNQYSPSARDEYGLSFDPYAATAEGVGITYEVTYTVPYLEVAAAIQAGEKFSIEASLGYSPIVSVEDVDDHVLRSKLNVGDCDGTALMAAVDGRFNFTEKLFALFGASYLAIDAEGTQSQRFYAGPLTGLGTDIDLDISSEQVYVYLNGGYAF